MADKDMSEKILFSFNDMFANVVNLYFTLSGINITVKPEDLEDLRGRSFYKFGDDLHEQERDIVKLWKPGDFAICIIGLENQTDIDPDLPLRIFSYEGADYRGQLNDKKNAPHFVLTIVLYYGTKRHWTAPKTLFERLNVPEEFRPFVNDFHINVIELAWLEDELSKMFGGNLYLLIDYLKQVRKGEDYVMPEGVEITHVDAMFKLFRALTGDYKFETLLNELPKGEDRMITTKIPSFLDVIEKRGLDKGRTETANKIADRLLARGISPEEVAEIINFSDFDK